MENCWDLDVMEKMTDDCLGFLKALFIDPFSNKYIKVLIIINLVFHVPLWTTQFYYFMNPFNINLVAMHIPSALTFLYAYMSIIIVTFFHKKLNYVMSLKNEICWSLNTCSKEVRKAILKQANYIFFVTVVNIILALIAYTTAITRYNSGKPEIIYQIVFLEQHFTEYGHILVRIFQATLAMFIMPMIAPIYIAVYFVMHLVFQARIINARFKQIADYPQSNNNLYSDENFQRQVYDRIRFCAIRSQRLKSLCVLGLEMVPPFVVTYLVLSMLLVVSFLGAYYLNTELYIPLLISIIIVSCYTGVVGFETGQKVEDEYLKSYDILIDLPWYLFDTRNRKMLLFILVHAKTPITFSPYEMFPVNRDSIVKLYKVFSTVSAFLAKTRDGLNSSN